MRGNLPPKEKFLGKTIEEIPDYVIREHVASGSNGHLYRAVNEQTNNEWAIKIVPISNIVSKDEGDEYLEEAKKANTLDNNSIVRYHRAVRYSDTESEYVVFACDYVRGKSLRDYVRKNASEIDVPFVENFLRTMFGLLYELERRQYQHGDLHAGNVLVAKSEFDMDGRIDFRVTDFGVRRFSGHPTHATDYLTISQILNDLLNCIEYTDCEGRNRYAYNVLRDDFLKRHLIETDPTADLLSRNPRSMAEKLNTIDNDYRQKGDARANARLVTPFDYPNCEPMGKSHLLLKSLYSDRLLSLSKMRERPNLVLTGPRGCGKTTVFRALSLEYLTSVKEDDPQRMEYIGIYYRCDDLYFAFPRYELPARNEALDVPMHFLIVTLLATMLEQVAEWAQRHFAEEFQEKTWPLVADLWETLGLPRPNSPTVDSMPTLVNRLKRERERARKKQRFVHVEHEPVEGYFDPEMMIAACGLVRNHLSFLEHRPFYFFIDDYSDPKITHPLQTNLNRLLMYRNSDVFFKLSTESPISFSRQDVDGKQFVESREYDLLNLGLRYLKDDSDRREQFLEDLFARRFSEVEDYPVRNLEELLGSLPRNENAAARLFRRNRDEENRASDTDLRYYAGYETIASMCSGDIHYMIRLVSSMVENFGGHEDLAASTDTPRIPFRKQNGSIRAAAGEFMESIRTLPERGPHLADVINAFGQVAHSYLLHETSTNETGNPPHQASRIEPYEPLALSDETRKVLNDLLRYSILIEDPSGKSRRGKVVPRYYLRRYLIPHFNLTFSRRDSLQLENHKLEMLLSEPEEFEKAERLKSKEDAARRRGRLQQQEERGLFDND